MSRASVEDAPTRVRRRFWPTAGYLLLISAAAFLFILLYAGTFRGHPIHSWTHGPFNFESGIYRDYAIGKIDPALTDNDKLIKHLLCAVAYPRILRVLDLTATVRDAPLVCSVLSGLMIAVFGIWLVIRTRNSPFVLPAVAALGFSFTTWYAGSVWESRSFIALGAVILLIALDRLARRPSLPALLLSILALIFSLLITVGNAYLIPLIPFSLLCGSGKIGFRRLVLWSLFSLFVVVTAVAVAYQVGGTLLNPRLKLSALTSLAGHELDHIGASTERFTVDQFGNVARQALVYSLGGLYIPADTGTGKGNEMWAMPDAWKIYFTRLFGTLFAIGYLVLTAVVLGAGFRTGAWWRDPLVPIIGFWIILYTSFFVYFNPWAGPVYAAELQPLIWSLPVVIFSRLRRARKFILAGFYLIVPLLVWNNWSVIELFKIYHGVRCREMLTSRIHQTRGNYGLWVWEVKPEKKTGNLVRVEIAHAAPGRRGGFRIVAYADTDGDARPDQLIAESDYFTADLPGEWSSFEFKTGEERIYVGNTWPAENEPLVYRGLGDWPESDSPLEGRFYHIISPGRAVSAGPAFTNLRISFPRD